MGKARAVLARPGSIESAKDARAGEYNERAGNGASGRSRACVTVQGNSSSNASGVRASTTSEPRERSERAKPRASDRAGESEGQSPTGASEYNERATGTERAGEAASE